MVATGLTMAHKIQDVYKMDDRVEHVMYEKNVSFAPLPPMWRVALTCLLA